VPVIKSHVVVIISYDSIIKSQRIEGVSASLFLSRIRLVHEGDLSGNCCPLKFAAERFVALLALKFFPFKELVSTTSSTNNP